MENNTTPTPTGSTDHESVGLQVAFSLIASSSFFFNLLFCVILLRNHAMLKKSHNILLFSLAVVDMLTGNTHSFTSDFHLSTKYYRSLNVLLCVCRSMIKVTWDVKRTLRNFQKENTAPLTRSIFQILLMIVCVATKSSHIS